ncbi:hypothetical protein [Saccharicrinis aurantiacus]|uniref:hypothetical protein n=1 Tax=Saccharicrinis aurantiacus TaxID=1849719 RepID=UPI0015C5311D|nr:hypothetical protein [Saccharicrinis aurantiacus]
MKNLKFLFAVVAMIGAMSLASCNKDEEEVTPEVPEKIQPLPPTAEQPLPENPTVSPF